MKNTAAAIILILLLATTAAGLSTAADGFSDRILQTSSATTFGLAQILQDLTGVPLIFVGEQHRNIHHHDLQLRVLRTLKNLGKPVAVGLEMFTARDQEYLDSWVRGSLPEKEFIRIHENNWGSTWEFYRPIYRYAREKEIPLIGLNVPEEITTQAARQGFSSLSEKQRSELPLVSCDIDEDYKALIRKALTVHGEAADISEFQNFCEAQLIWDTTMAYRLVRYLKQNPDQVVVVLAGNSHSWRPGIPEQLNRFAEGINYRIILPEIRPAQTRRSTDASVTDYLWLLE